MLQTSGWDGPHLKNLSGPHFITSCVFYPQPTLKDRHKARPSLWTHLSVWKTSPAAFFCFYWQVCRWDTEAVYPPFAFSGKFWIIAPHMVSTSLTIKNGDIKVLGVFCSANSSWLWPRLFRFHCKIHLILLLLRHSWWGTVVIEHWLVLFTVRGGSLILFNVLRHATENLTAAHAGYD